MAFIELQPTRTPKDNDTGVRVSLNDRGGLSVSLSGNALLAVLPDLGREGGVGTPAAAVKALLDWDPVCPRLRLIPADDGRFKLAKPPLGNRVRLVRIGHRPEFPATRFKGLACTWEHLDDGELGLDIDLPREMRATVTISRPVSAPSHSGNSRQTQVTLPATRGTPDPRLRQDSNARLRQDKEPV